MMHNNQLTVVNVTKSNVSSHSIECIPNVGSVKFLKCESGCPYVSFVADHLLLLVCLSIMLVQSAELVVLHAASHYWITFLKSQ